MDVLGYILAFGPLVVIVLVLAFPERRGRDLPDIVFPDAETGFYDHENKTREWSKWSRVYSRLS